MSKRIIVLICFVLLTAAMFSCSKRVENLDEFEKLVISAGSESQDLKPFASEVYVIIPKGCSAELAVRAEKLVLGIKERTDIGTYLKYDDEAIVIGNNVLEILLGNTSRDISTDAFRTMKANDYLCMYDRGALLIGGKTDSATLAALDRFEKDILSTATKASLMHESAHFEHFDEYEIDTITINGFYIYDYAINADTETAAYGDVLSRYILKKSGYILEANLSVGKNIDIALDENALVGLATIETKGQNILIRANDTYGLSAAVAKFASLLISEESDGVYALDLKEKIFVEYEGEKTEFLISAVEYGVQNSVEFNSAVGETLRGATAEMVLFLKMSDSYIDYLKTDLNQKYDVVLTVKTGESGSAIVCGKENISAEGDLGDDRIYADVMGRDSALWSVVLLESYDVHTLNAADPYNTLFVIREDNSLPLEYANLPALSFSFGGEKVTYRLLLLQDLLDVSVTVEERVENYGSCAIFWKIGLSRKCHVSFKDLQNSIN